jgi:adenylate kinase family enzyme
MHILLSLDRSLFNYLSAQIEISKRSRKIKQKKGGYIFLSGATLVDSNIVNNIVKKKTEHNNYEKKTVPFDDV